LLAELYDRYMGPLLFEPYAKIVAERAAVLQPDRILETVALTHTSSASHAAQGLVPGSPFARNRVARLFCSSMCRRRGDGTRAVGRKRRANVRERRNSD
jgi:hypothetical protein